MHQHLCTDCSALCAWTFDAFECVRRTTSCGVPTELYVPKESADVDHIPELADAELKTVESEGFWRGPSFQPARLQIALVPHVHFSVMQSCRLIIVSDNSLARRVPTMR
jgi:hypothetical protein